MSADDLLIEMRDSSSNRATRESMQPVHLLSGWDTAILMAPFFGILAFWMFGLDERVTAPRERPARRRFCHTDSNGQSVFCDPDGRTPKSRRITPLRIRPGVENTSVARPLKGQLRSRPIAGYLTEGKRDLDEAFQAAAVREFP